MGQSSATDVTERLQGRERWLGAWFPDTWSQAGVVWL